MKSRWITLAKTLIVIFTIILFMNALSLFIEVKRDLEYSNRAYGLETLNDYFDNGQYQDIYECALKNEISDQNLYADTSQYEAFGRYYHAYTMARIYEDNSVYLKQMEAEKENISWKKILSVIEELEKQLKQ